MKISNWIEVSGKKALRGKFSVELPSGLIIHKICFFEKDGKRWVALPSERAGSDVAVFTPLIEFSSRQVFENFRKQCVLALEAGGHA
ncbi:MAG TPA: hypothetical protein VJW94_18180 [Candidatus Acidoferrum sp.]|nr:hypothetical protein [Candidatus Acidoferrum sp.]